MSQDPPEPLMLTSDQKYDLLEAIDQLQFLKHLEPIAQSLQTLAEQERSTTPQQASEPGRSWTLEPPVAEVPAEANPIELTMPDGRKVPTKVIRALAEYDESVWPGALDPKARASVAALVIQQIKSDEPPPLSTNYPFCLDDPENVSNDSPCIKRAEHPGKHQDNNDGTW